MVCDGKNTNAQFGGGGAHIGPRMFAIHGMLAVGMDIHGDQIHDKPPEAHFYTIIISRMIPDENGAGDGKKYIHSKKAVLTKEISAGNISICFNSLAR
ncbi:MAG TPA: hypothetical protein DIT32_06900 [Peptococcaceae bacterium]|nr:hypothetical protein [Peptococcaceae bacterium]